MNDLTKDVLNTFFAYAKAFESLEPNQVAPFFNTPTMLMTPKDFALMLDEATIKLVFLQLFTDLKQKNFKESELNSYQVTQLSDNQAIVSGTATRLDQSGAVLEEFGLTYTFRLDGSQWKIVIGVLHEITPIVGEKWLKPKTVAA
jgi:hypothetical protein